MTLVVSSTLSSGALSMAEVIVAAHLGGSSLTAHSVSESGTLGSSNLIPLRDGPATSIQALTLSGAPAVGILSSAWALDVGAVVPYSRMWGAPVTPPYTVTYTAGWTVDTLPKPIEQAVLLLAAQLEARPDLTVSSERIGPESRTWDTSHPVPPQLSSLLSRWTAVRY